MAKEKAVMGLIIYQKTPLIASAAYGYVASRICGFSHLKRLKLVLDSECIVRFLQLQRFLDEDWKCRHELQLDLPLPCGEKGKSRPILSSQVSFSLMSLPQVAIREVMVAVRRRHPYRREIGRAHV